MIHGKNQGMQEYIFTVHFGLSWKFEFYLEEKKEIKEENKSKEK